MRRQGRVTRRICTVVCACALLVGTGRVMAQFPPPPPPPAERPGGSATSLSSVEGTVKKVDIESGKVEIAAGLFGLFVRTLAVTPDTQIQLEGRRSSLANIREGDRVRAAYEAREGQSIATSINVTPERRRGPAPAGTPQQ